MEDRPEDNAVPLEVISASALEQLTKGEIESQVAIAKRYPRSISQFQKKAMAMATLDEETAESCFYNLPRANKEIKGPSIRLAEIVAGAWTNTRSGARVISNNGKTITAQGVCFDLESNTLICMEVSRNITHKDGKTYTQDMQTVAGNAACSIALRNAIFKVVPMAYVRPIYEQARRVAIGDASTLASRRTRVIEYFGKMGVSQTRVLMVLGKATPDDVTLDDLETLTGLKTALKSGDTTIDEEFPKEEPKVDLTKKRAEKNDEAPKTDPAATAATASGPATTSAPVTTANTAPPASSSPPADKPKPKPKADKPAAPAPASEQAKVALPSTPITPLSELALLQAEMARLVITEQPLIDLAKRVEDEGIRIAATVTSLSQLPDDELKTLRVNLPLLAMLLTEKGPTQ